MNDFQKQLPRGILKSTYSAKYYKYLRFPGKYDFCLKMGVLGRFCHGNFMIFFEQHRLAFKIDEQLQALREKCPNTKLFLVRIFLYSY